MRTGAAAVLTGLLFFCAAGDVLARTLGDGEKRLIGQSVANFSGQESIRIEWTPFVEDFNRNPIERRIYCATLVTGKGKKLPFMVRIVEEVDYRILAVQPEHIYAVKVANFTDTLNNTATLQYCGEAGYAVSAP